MSKWELYFHLVWATKNRTPYLTHEKEEVAHRAIRSLAEAEGVEVLELNGMPDHVHLLIKTGAEVNLSRFVKRVKGTASSLLNDMSDHQEWFRWQEGYFAATVTPSHVPKIRAYIRNQKQHHQDQTTHPFWEDTGERLDGG